MLNRDEYIAKLKLQLDELNAAMKDLEAKAQDAREDSQSSYHENLNALRLHSTLAIDKLDELKVAGEKNWDILVAETEKVRDAFVDSFHYFKSHF